MTRHAPTIAAQIVCCCCHDSLCQEDFGRDTHTLAHTQAVEALHGGPVCQHCLDAHVISVWSGVAVLKTDAYRDPITGDFYASEDEFQDMERNEI